MKLKWRKGENKSYQFMCIAYWHFVIDKIEFSNCFFFFFSCSSKLKTENSFFFFICDVYAPLFTVARHNKVCRQRLWNSYTLAALLWLSESFVFFFLCGDFLFVLSCSDVRIKSRRKNVMTIKRKKMLFVVVISIFSVFFHLPSHQRIALMSYKTYIIKNLNTTSCTT